MLPCEAVLALMMCRDAFSRSQIELAVSTAADILSSRGLNELNPVNGRGPFGARQAGTSAAITGVTILAERLIVHRWPKAAGALRWCNVGLSIEHGAAAAHNWRQ